MSRIEIHLVAMRDVAFEIAGQRFSFGQGSSIHAENSHKYGERGARVLLLAGGWTPIAEWSDPAGDFSDRAGRGRARPFRAVIARRGGHG